MTISYPIESFESEDSDKIHVIWNSDRTWFIEKPDLNNYLMLRSEDFDPILKGEEIRFNSGMFGWLSIIKTAIADDRLEIEMHTQMWSDVPPQLNSKINISIADFVKCKEITLKDKQTKPVHYCTPDGGIVFDRDSFNEGQE